MGGKLWYQRLDVVCPLISGAIGTASGYVRRTEFGDVAIPSPSMITHEFVAELCISRPFGISLSPSLTSAGARIICTLFALVLRICDGGETCSLTVKMFPAPACWPWAGGIGSCLSLPSLNVALSPAS